MLIIRRVSLAVLLFAPLAYAKPSASSLIERAKAAVTQGAVDEARDLVPIVERLRASHDSSEQDTLISGIEDLGGYDSANPAAVKAYFRSSAPPVLLEIVRAKGPGLVRGNALMLLRTLNVEDSVIDQAIAIARADKTDAKDTLGVRAGLLQDWKQGRVSIGNVPTAAASGSAKEQSALLFLRQRNERVTPDSLGNAALNGDTEVVTALLDAGIDVNAKLVGGLDALHMATSVGCSVPAAGDSRLQTVDVLVKHGADVKSADDLGNTILMGAVDCAVPVIERLIAAGAPIDAANAQSFTPLKLAFVKGKWDVVRLLVDHGARVSSKAIDELFFEKPSDPEKLALIKRATGK